MMNNHDINNGTYRPFIEIEEEYQIENDSKIKYNLIIKDMNGNTIIDKFIQIPELLISILKKI